MSWAGWSCRPSVGCGARAHSGPCPYWLIWLAVLCQGPLQAAPQGLGLGIRSPVRYPAAAGVTPRPSRPPCGRGSEGRKARCDLCGRRTDCGPPQGQGRRPQPPPRLGCRRQRGAAGRYARPQGGAGGADGPTAPTQWGPGRPGAPTPQPSAGCDRGKARAAARLRAWPCGGHGWPALRLAAGKRRRRADLSRRRRCVAAAAAGG